MLRRVVLAIGCGLLTAGIIVLALTGSQGADAHGVVSVWFNPTSGERAYVRGTDPARAH